MSLEAPETSSSSWAEVPRWELYRLLADPVRVRLLALVAAEELGVGEIAELLGEGLTKVSRHAAALRDAGLVVSRRNGTWVLLRLPSSLEQDPVVADALGAGRRLLEAEGTLARVEALVRARDAKAREFFAREPGAASAFEAPGELSAYLAALAPLISPRAFAVDAGTGEGALLDVLAPVFDEVVALDRSPARLKRAEARAEARGYGNVRFVDGELDGPEIEAAVRAGGRAGADLVFASRVLHHAPQPARAMHALTRLLRPATGDRPGGTLLVLDYAAHDDLALKEAQADLWAGFDEAELLESAAAAGLADVRLRTLPPTFRGHGPDRNLDWILLTASRGAQATKHPPRGHAS